MHLHQTHPLTILQYSPLAGTEWGWVSEAEREEGGWILPDNKRTTFLHLLVTMLMVVSLPSLPVSSFLSCTSSLAFFSSLSWCDTRHPIIADSAFSLPWYSQNSSKFISDSYWISCFVFNSVSKAVLPQGSTLPGHNICFPVCNISTYCSVIAVLWRLHIWVPNLPLEEHKGH